MPVLASVGYQTVQVYAARRQWCVVRCPDVVHRLPYASMAPRYLFPLKSLSARDISFRGEVLALRYLKEQLRPSRRGDEDA
jgi:hypothetical protein